MLLQFLIDNALLSFLALILILKIIGKTRAINSTKNSPQFLRRQRQESNSILDDSMIDHHSIDQCDIEFDALNIHHDHTK